MDSGESKKVDIFIDIITILFLMLWSGGGFTYGLWPFWVLIGFPISLLIYKKRECRLNNKLFRTVLLLTFIVLLQTIIFNGDFNTTSKYLLVLF